MYVDVERSRAERETPLIQKSSKNSNIHKDANANKIKI